MKTSRALLSGEFVFQKFHTDYDDFRYDFEEFDPEVPDKVIETAIRFETDRRVTIELWTKKMFMKRDRKNPNIRLANFFEVCAFATEFEKAHIKHGNYCGFDSIIGKLIWNKYYPVIYETEEANTTGLYIVNNKNEPLPDNSLVVTKETLL
jgi:hypothetical protein